MCRPVCTGGLRFPDPTQRCQGLFGLAALCVLGERSSCLTRRLFNRTQNTNGGHEHWSIELAVVPLRLGRFYLVSSQHLVDELALGAFERPQIRTVATRFNAGQHHATLTRRTAWSCDRNQRWFGARSHSRELAAGSVKEFDPHLVHPEHRLTALFSPRSFYEVLAFLD